MHPGCRFKVREGPPLSNGNSINLLSKQTKLTEFLVQFARNVNYFRATLIPHDMSGATFFPLRKELANLPLFILTSAPRGDRLALRDVPGYNMPQAPLRREREPLPAGPVDRLSAMTE